MFKKSPLTIWLDKRLFLLESNFQKHKTAFEIIFAIALGIIFEMPQLLPKGVDISMTPQFWVMTIFIWIAVFCAIFLIVNSRKSEVNKEKKLDEIAKSINDLILEIRRDRDERNKPK
jgi:hypothetical protein